MRAVPQQATSAAARIAGPLEPARWYPLPSLRHGRRGDRHVGRGGEDALRLPRVEAHPRSGPAPRRIPRAGRHGDAPRSCSSAAQRSNDDALEPSRPNPPAAATVNPPRPRMPGEPRRLEIGEPGKRQARAGVASTGVCGAGVAKRRLPGLVSPRSRSNRSPRRARKASTTVGSSLTPDRRRNSAGRLRRDPGGHGTARRHSRPRRCGRRARSRRLPCRPARRGRPTVRRRRWQRTRAAALTGSRAVSRSAASHCAASCAGARRRPVAQQVGDAGRSAAAAWAASCVGDRRRRPVRLPEVDRGHHPAQGRRRRRRRTGAPPRRRTRCTRCAAATPHEHVATSVRRRLGQAASTPSAPSSRAGTRRPHHSQGQRPSTSTNRTSHRRSPRVAQGGRPRSPRVEERPVVDDPAVAHDPVVDLLERPACRSPGGES